MARNVLVVGAGIVGASLAWHLARAGCHVTVAGVQGGVATPCTFAWINASWGNPEFYFHFRRRSMAGWRRLEAALSDLGVDWCGGMLWDLPDDRLSAYAEQHAGWGYGIRMIDRAEAQRLEPGLLSPPERAVHVAEEGAVEAVDAAHVLLNGAQAAGASFIPDTRISRLVMQGDRVTGAETGTGALIDADEVVLAAGTGTPDLLATAGLRLAMTAPPGLIAHSTIAGRRMLNGMIFAPDVHVRQTREGRLIVGADFTGADPGEDPAETARGLLRAVRRYVAGSEALDLAFHTIGYRPTPAGGLPAIGRMPGIEGLYVTVMHSGVTLAPLVGELAAEEIVTGRRDPDLGPFDPGRPALAKEPSD